MLSNGPMTTADVYARISQAAEATPGVESAAVARQLDECRRFIEERGWTLGREWVDDSISATTGAHRPAFEGLLADPPAVLVVWHSDRLVRVNADLERVINTGMAVHAVHASFLDLATPAGRATARTITAWAQYEGEQKALRQRAKNEQDRAAGKPYWKQRPLGFSLDTQHVEAEAAAIAKAYADVLDGTTLSAIAREWNAAGLRTTYKNNAIDSIQVRRTLLSPHNAGILTYDGNEIGAGAWEPIIDEPTFRAVEAILKDPSRYRGGGGRLANLLTGVALCGTCAEDGVQNYVVKGTRKAGVGEYRCKAKRHNRRAPVEHIDNTVIGRTLAVLTSGGAAVLDDSDRDRADELRMEAAGIRGQLTEWEAAAASLGPSEYLRITAALRERLAAVQDALTAITADTLLVTEDGRDWTNAEVAEHAVEQWKALPLAKRQALLRKVWKRIVLRPSVRYQTFGPTLGITMEPAEGVTEPV